eukprot:322071_1
MDLIREIKVIPKVEMRANQSEMKGMNHRLNVFKDQLVRSIQETTGIEIQLSQSSQSANNVHIMQFANKDALKEARKEIDKIRANPKYNNEYKIQFRHISKADDETKKQVGFVNKMQEKVYRIDIKNKTDPISQMVKNHLKSREECRIKLLVLNGSNSFILGKIFSEYVENVICIHPFVKIRDSTTAIFTKYFDQSLIKNTNVSTPLSQSVLKSYNMAKRHVTKECSNDNACGSTSSQSVSFSKPKYQTLKEELLQNGICPISTEIWNTIYDKATQLCNNIGTCFSDNGDTNTPFSRDIPHLNESHKIESNKKISTVHLVSVLLCTDVPELLPKIQRVSVNVLYSELEHWLNILAQTVIFYGNNLSRTDVVYMYWRERIHFDQCSIHCDVPLIAVKDQKQIPRTIGTVFELSGTQSDSAWAAPYFAMDLISPENRGCLFFNGTLRIKSISCDSRKYDMAPLSLYESILNGGIFSIQEVSATNVVTLTERYPDIDRMLDHYENKHDAVYINNAEIMKKISGWGSPLRKRLRMLRETHNAKESGQFIWKPTVIEVREFITEEKDYIVSKTMKSSTGAQFYFEMSSTLKQHKTKRCGAVSLTLFRLPSRQNHASVSCEFYCKQMDFYVRFDDTIIKMDGNESNAKQMAFFEWKHLEHAIRITNTIEWKIVIIHKGIKRVNVHNESKNKIADIMKKHKLEAIRLHDEMTKATEWTYLPLHRFDENHVCDVIKCWVFSDSRFKDHLERMIRIFSDSSLSVLRINAFSLKNIRRILERALLGFMTKETFDIVLKRIKYWKTVDILDNENKILQHSTGPEEIASILFKYPLNKLLARIRNKNDIINGQKFIQYYGEFENYPWIKNVTGWNDTEVYQIHSLLFKYDAFSSSGIKRNLKRVLSQQCMDASVSTAIIGCIESYDDTELKTLSCKIKNGSHELHEFSDRVMDAVSKVDDEWIKATYQGIADCFVTTYSKFTDIPSEYELKTHPSWTCCNCSNYNFSNFIGGKINVNLSICSLCGMKQIDTVIMILKHYDTYTMLNSDTNSKILVEGKEHDRDDIDDLIDTAMQSMEFEFNLSCLNRNDNEPCPSLMRLARQLIIYKRWISKVKGNIKSTTWISKATIEKYVTAEEFKAIFIHSIDKIIKHKDAITILTELSDNELNKHTFLSLSRKLYGAKIADCTNLKLGDGCRLYTAIEKSVKDKA